MRETVRFDEQLQKELIDRILAVVQPVRVVLFGSAARGEMGPNSDVDVLVVVPEGTKRGRVEGDIYVNLIGYGIPVDVIAATERDLEKHGDNWSLVYYHALREGRDIYTQVNELGDAS
jgi:uncharacterized protein